MGRKGEVEGLALTMDMWLASESSRVERPEEVLEGLGLRPSTVGVEGGKRRSKSRGGARTRPSTADEEGGGLALKPLAYNLTQSKGIEKSFKRLKDRRVDI